MIEVEKKFILNNIDQARLIVGAVFLSEKTFTEVYYDTEDYKLTRIGRWLRRRDEKFELKSSLTIGQIEKADQYEEIEDEAKIIASLGLDPKISLAENIKQADYVIFYEGTTTRTKYKLGEFIIDLDYVVYKNDDNATYRIAEIELLIPSKDGVDEAAEKILNLAKDLNLTIGPVRGKVIEYLRLFKPDHFQILLDAGVIR
jgi:thiamine-triphosphatase